ncbi:hypothetical protein V8G54_037390 [Vigna mungo]|uniref:Uncharacterized protein n=1 Tax=Vigna mungo TaxID=3915 RepID=A0AAQ3MIJ7_VIGMU
MQISSTLPFSLNTSLTSSCAFFITLGFLIISAIAQSMVVFTVSNPAKKMSVITALILSMVKQTSWLLSLASWKFRRTSTKSSTDSRPCWVLDLASLCSLIMASSIRSIC